MAFMWSLIFRWNELPNKKGAASLKVPLSVTKGASSLLRQEEALQHCSTEIWVEALSKSFRACCAASAASLVFRKPDLADSSIFTRGIAASRANPCRPAKFLPYTFA